MIPQGAVELLLQEKEQMLENQTQEIFIELNLLNAKGRISQLLCHFTHEHSLEKRATYVKKGP